MAIVLGILSTGFASPSPVFSIAADGSIGVDALGNKTIRTAVATGVGDDNYTYSKADQCVVLVFPLPDLNGESISSASLSLDYKSSWPGGSDPFPKHLQLYGSRYDGSSTVQESDYAFKSTVPVGGTLLQADLATLTQSSGDWASLTTSTTGEIALGGWLQQQYDDGASAGDYVFLTVALDGNTVNLVSVALSEDTAYNPPVLNIVSEPEVTVTNTVAATNSASDGSIGVDSLGNKTIRTNVTTGVGDDNYTYSKADQCVVLVFQLPDLEDGAITSASLSLDYKSSWPGGSDPFPKYLQLYGSRCSSSSAVQNSDYAFKSTAPLAGTLLQADLATVTQSAGDWTSLVTSAAGEIALGGWLQAQYNSGAMAGDYVFLTVALDGNTANLISVALTEDTAYNPPSLQISYTMSGSGIPSELAANEIGVDCNSLVNGPGTNWATAFQTVSAAIASSDFSATGRNVIVIKGGTYREKIDINKSGTSGTPLVLMPASPNDHVVISGMKALDSWTSLGGGIYKNTQMGTNYVGNVYVDNFKKPNACMPNSGWWKDTSCSIVSNATTGLAEVTLYDTGHLIGLTNSLTGASIYAWNLDQNLFVEVPIVSFNASTGKIRFDLLGSAYEKWIHLTGGINYSLRNQNSLMDIDGEWAVINESGVNAVCLKSGSVPSSVESPFLQEELVTIQNQSYVQLIGLDICGAAWGWNATRGYVDWNAHTVWVSGGSNIGIYDCIVRQAENTGIYFTGTIDGEIANCLIRKNAIGLCLYDSTNVTVRYTDIGHSLEDGLRVYHLANGCNIVSNYMHHSIERGHADAAQCSGGGGNTISHTFQGNIFYGSAQSMMTAATTNNLWQNNIFYGSGGNLLKLDKNTSGYSGYHKIQNNTIAVAGLAAVTLTWRNYDIYSNVFYTGNSKTVYNTGGVTNYNGDYNWFYPALRFDSPTLLTAFDPALGKDVSCTSLEEFQALMPGQDLHSSDEDPGFINAPEITVCIDRLRLGECTASHLYLDDNTYVYVGDHIEYGFDGVVRVVTAKGSENDITISPALSGNPARDMTLAVWGVSSDFIPDLRAGNTPCGSDIEIADYMNGDFDGDGNRDIPQVPIYLQ